MTPAGQFVLLPIHYFEGSIAVFVHGSSCHGWLCSSCDPGLLPNRCCRMGSTVSDGPSWTAVFSRSFSVSSDRSSTSSFSIPFEPGTPPFPIRIEREISRVCPSHRSTRHDAICDTTRSTCCDVLRRAAHHVRARALVRRISRRHSTSRACGKDVDVATRGTERVVRRGSFGRTEKKDWLRIRSSCRSRCRSLRRAKQAQVSRNHSFQQTGRSFARNERPCGT